MPRKKAPTPKQPTEQDLDAMLLGFEYKQRVGKVRAIIEGARGVVSSAQSEVDRVPLVPREIHEDLKEAHAALARARERLGALYNRMPPFGK